MVFIKKAQHYNNDMRYFLLEPIARWPFIHLKQIIFPHNHVKDSLKMQPEDTIKPMTVKQITFDQLIKKIANT